MDCKDNIGNILKIGDEVLILVPKTYTTYRKGVIKDFKNIRENGYGKILVEYDSERLYCNEKIWEQNQHNIKFHKKTTKAWRFSTNVIKYKKYYIVNDC